MSEVEDGQPAAPRLEFERTPPCRVCGSTQEVICWPPAKVETTICPECCPKAIHANGEEGHEFQYEAHAGYCCVHCGIQRSRTDWEPDDYD